MAEKKRMPPLRIDEVILLVDTYFQLQEIGSATLRNDYVCELSQSMRSLPFYPELRGDDAFRSCSGMNMCLSNVGYIDPANKSIFGHGSALQKKVFDYYYKRQNELKGIATSIRSISCLNIALLDKYKDYIGGQLPISYHHYLEATDKIVLRLKNECFNYHKTECVVCGEDLEAKYGYDATYLLETHIAVPLSQHRANMSISTMDILLLCPACHRLAHSNPELFDEANLKKRVKEWQQHV